MVTIMLGSKNLKSDVYKENIRTCME